MKHSRILLLAALALLSGCTSSHRPVYSGHEESTEGVPGFVNGKKVSPHVKLGQSYSVDGETYVPRNQPDYVEEGMASWYGPGFHGGKTANGEQFDANGLTAAHRTLPLPSIIKVTLLSTGKSAIVRVNDRGPFAHSRIIDLSRGAAEKIGLLRVGVGKVRIEYMKKESERFAELLGDGKDPNDIDVENDVVNYDGYTSPPRVEVASAQAGDMPPPQAYKKAHSPSFWDDASDSDVNAVDSDEPAARAVIANETADAAPLSEIAANDLSEPKQAAARNQLAAIRQPVAAPSARPEPLSENSPFNAMESADRQPASGEMQVASLTPNVARSMPATGSGHVYLQLGAFGNEQNAERLRDKFTGISPVSIIRKENANGTTLYHVRMGPFASNEASSNAQQQLAAQGAEAKLIKE